MATDYALALKIGDLDEAIEKAEFWLDQYKKETRIEHRHSAARFFRDSRARALELVEIVANHRREE